MLDRRAYQREWVSKRRAEFFNGKRCVQCGSTQRLELDHIDPSTKLSHKIFSWAKERREAELDKCQILCYVCHKAKSKEEFPSGIDHHACKIPDEMILDILLKYNNQELSADELGKAYNVDRRTIESLNKRKFIKDNYPELATRG